LVQSADLAPTLLDFLDLRSRTEADQDDLRCLGRSLEASSHGWQEGPVHEVLYLMGSQHAVARSRDCKLISAVEAPWKISPEKSRLYSLAEDPGESRDLLSEVPMGPVAEQLFDGLQSWLSRPIAFASSPQEQAP
jgi:arylsulfatase A-like enzyme